MISDDDRNLLKDWERFSLEEMRLMVENALRSTYLFTNRSKF